MRDRGITGKVKIAFYGATAQSDRVLSRDEDRRNFEMITEEVAERSTHPKAA